ncbi:MAG: hypothetical protein AAFX05_05510 [Planctomycetota bacterium]
MSTRLTLRVPSDYVLKRDVCSYGYFHLAPNTWDPARETLARVLDLSDGAATLIVAQPEDVPGAPLRVQVDRGLSRTAQGEAKRALSRMLRLEEEDLGAFHAVDPRWRASGRGRIFRSPTLFEDLVKTVTSCNVAWPSTRMMNRRLCEVINPAFPRPTQMARRRPATLRARCRVGYRDVRLVELAKLAAAGSIDDRWFEDPSNDDDAVYSALLELPGIGPYAASNMLQLLGRYSRLAMDSEAMRHGREVLGMEGTDTQVRRAIEQHYAQFGDHRFRSYWFELWTDHEKHKGPAWTWPVPA